MVKDEETNSPSSSLTFTGLQFEKLYFQSLINIKVQETAEIFSLFKKIYLQINPPQNSSLKTIFAPATGSALNQPHATIIFTLAFCYFQLLTTVLLLLACIYDCATSNQFLQILTLSKTLATFSLYHTFCKIPLSDDLLLLFSFNYQSTVSFSIAV